MVGRGHEITCGSRVSHGNDSRSVPFVRNSGGRRSGTSASTIGAGSLTSDKVRFRFQRTLTILTGLAQQGGIDASPGHEIRRQWTAASLRQQTASALGRHCAASNTATSVIDVNRSRANAHPVSQHHGITTSAVPEDVAHPDVVPYAPCSPQERWHGGQVKAHMSASRGP